jgi:L-fucose mutarotase/ribose pyranase (RbsD/FucU family)
VWVRVVDERGVEGMQVADAVLWMIGVDEGVDAEVAWMRCVDEGNGWM